MTVAGRWIGDVEGTPLELLIRSSLLGAWEVRLTEPGGRRAIRWFDDSGQAREYAAGVLSTGEWRPATH
ncbi:MAG: hypothetical protein HOU81_19830 [Hamadaea sp.]|uniref:hypothetical protein n=1 Tax=Hamadaea sp. TaxID=2024425 RepID=UPI0017B51988|nr:hypothetical protein [Hamadaea sp.]NUR73072.1 hypothetical protein [Hamadaea sp.]NUT18302.1 hypothetical protein [Hamadaea sp.]